MFYEITEIVNNPVIYENINENMNLIYDEYKAHLFFDNKVKYEVLTYLRKTTDKVLIIGQGAVGKQVKDKLPIYQRWSWCKELKDFSIIMLNDPTLYLNDYLEAGWFQGTIDDFYMEKIKIILDNIVNHMNISMSNVYHYGASAGGFTALCLAGMMKGSSAIVDITQTDLTKYRIKIAVDNMLKTSYPGKTLEEVSEEYKDRISVVHLFRKYKNIPNILYLQNINDNAHNRWQLSPFISLLMETYPTLHESKNSIFELHFYDIWLSYKGGHVPLDKERLYEKIKYAIDIFSKKKDISEFCKAKKLSN